jgi:mono/diheme cytochrome c family protein
MADERQVFTEAQTLGGVVVPAEVLNKGREAYTEYCYACHGNKGDGQGPASRGYRPSPRDFREAKFKFAAVSPGSLPHDDDLRRIITGGLNGTPMLPWSVPEPALNGIIQYIKTFSPRWKKEKAGEKITESPDPWKGKAEEGATRGMKVYHGLAQCWACHPAYATKKEIWEASKETRGTGAVEYRNDMYGAVAKEADYKDGDHKLVILPPDFLMAEVKAGVKPSDLYRTIASGIGGTAMPQWKGSMPDEGDIWALAYYVRSLVDMKGTPAARALREKLERQPAFEPPPEAPPPPPPQKGAAPAPGAKEPAKAEPPKAEPPKAEPPKK